jgi:hypothetical protein
MNRITSSKCRRIISTNLTEFKDNKNKIEDDSQAAVGVIGRRVTTTVANKFAHITKVDDPGTYRKQFTTLWKFLFEKYGPTNQNDVDNLLKQLSEVNDSKSYAKMLSEYNKIQLQLSKIPKRDAEGNPITIPSRIPGQPDVPLYHGKTPDEMRSVLLQQLGKSNKLFYDLKVDAERRPNIYTYDVIVEEMENLIKAKHDIAYDSDAESTTQPRGKGENNQQQSSTTTTVNANVAYNNNGHACKNCGSSNHRSFECPKPICNIPGEKFRTGQERYEHHKAKHAIPNRHDYRQDNRQYNQQSRYQGNNSNSNYHQRDRSKSRSRDHRGRSRSRSNSYSRYKKGDYNKSHYKRSHNRSYSSSRSNSRDRNHNKKVSFKKDYRRGDSDNESDSEDIQAFLAKKSSSELKQLRNNISTEMYTRRNTSGNY